MVTLENGCDSFLLPDMFLLFHEQTMELEQENKDT